MGREIVFEIVDRDRMNILGLMLGRIIEANLAKAETASIARRLKGRVGITAGRMSVTLAFDRGSVSLTRGVGEKLRASVRGTLEGLLHVGAGRGPVRSFLTGDLSFSGNPFFLMRLVPLIRATRSGT